MQVLEPSLNHGRTYTTMQSAMNNDIMINDVSIAQNALMSSRSRKWCKVPNHTRSIILLPVVLFYFFIITTARSIRCFEFGTVFLEVVWNLTASRRPIFILIPMITYKHHHVPIFDSRV